MRMNDHFMSALRRYGNTVVIDRSGRAETVRAFVQPLRRRHRLYINDRYIPAGYFDNRYLLYIGPPDQFLDTGDKVSCLGTEYSVVTAEMFAVRDENVYVWAILMPVVEAEEDYYDDNIDG